jgi:hypothetical protein
MQGLGGTEGEMTRSCHFISHFDPPMGIVDHASCLWYGRARLQTRGIESSVRYQARFMRCCGSQLHSGPLGSSLARIALV